ncbi:hypothetical protein AMAG_13316 [Allomyces macrogynus ATCC 38327]|uniref:Uncharacterized protein n=1 Tax=Allomyces macrogynus (strain ATCC 38327) TaxID=578462 RepID=A0A0L0T052_ALLM3|nr:hypothetical protein AMAG_13316 [Allomyces macrogynus ATCC 38327]|eukprot:KNE68151.1 hypothetical protein AMAG_13316 [Allomyces macrogynus ATCC 38327]
MPPSALLEVSRVISMTTALMSLRINVDTYNCVWQRYKGRAMQNLLMASLFLAMIVDCMNLAALGSWLVDHSWPWWGRVTVSLNVLKRIYSIVPVYFNFLRMTAYSRNLRNWRKYAPWYTAGYALLGTLSSALHLHAYIASDWNSGGAWYQPSYPAYRGVDVACVLYYSLVALLTDVSFLAHAKSNPFMATRFAAIKMFYNPQIRLGEECAAIILVLVPLILGISNPDYASAPYTEPYLLALVTLNGAFSVKATSVVHGDTSNDSQSNSSSATGGTGGGTGKSGGTELGVTTSTTAAVASLSATALPSTKSALAAGRYTPKVTLPGTSGGVGSMSVTGRVSSTATATNGKLGSALTAAGAAAAAAGPEPVVGTPRTPLPPLLPRPKSPAGSPVASDDAVDKDKRRWSK